MAIIGHSKFIPVFLGNIVRKRLEQPFLAIPNLYQSSWEKLLEINMDWPFLPFQILYQSFWEKLSEKDWNNHIWPFLIYTSPFGKHCPKKLEHPFLAIPNLYQSFWETLLEKDSNKHFWPFLIYTSLSGKNCWKKFGITIFGHSKFIPVFLGNIVRKRLEQAFFAIPDLYQFFWEKLSEQNWNNHFWPLLIYTSLFEKNVLEKIQNDHIWPFLIYASPFGKKIVWKYWNSHFWPFQIYVIHFGKNCQKIIGMAIFGHSEFVPVFLGKIVRKKLEQPYLAIPNLYQSFWENLLEKIQNGHSKFIPVFLGNIVRKRLEQTFLAIPNLYQSFWGKLLEKIWNIHFWPFQTYTSLSGKNCQKKIGTSIFRHSWFIPVLLGKILIKKLE